LARTDSLIRAFQIPPFLLPIYQAAGIQYDVPWPVLAAINWVETDFGRDLSVSPAGAMGWMQFMPSTWARYGVDAADVGGKDPYDPVDAIFAAARYLHAAGATRSLPGAIFAYNHAASYVQSVLLRAKLISAYPAVLINALTELMQAGFPVDGAVQGFRHPLPDRGSGEPGATDRALIFADPGSAAVAVTDGTILRLGYSLRLGRYVVLRDAFGNAYTYAGLGRIARAYAVPKPVTVSPREVADALEPMSTKRPSTPATALRSPNRPRPRANHEARDSLAHAGAMAATHPAAVLGAKERLFAHPLRPQSYASGGMTQVSVTDPRGYFAGTLTLRAGQYTVAPLRRGATVVAGTILGRLEPSRPGARSSLTFMISPAGKHAPRIDPEPILRSWQLAEEAGMYGSDAKGPLIDSGARDPSVGQVLLMSKQRLERQLLADRRVTMSACERRGIRAGLVDRRVLAAIEYLAVLGLRPTISGLVCDQVTAEASGASFEITQVDGTPVLDHQGPQSIAALAVRALLVLQGAMRPAEIVSLHSYPGQPSTLALPDHANRIEVDYKADTGGLDAREWASLTSQLTRLTEPSASHSP
jgi:Transglycosylase SLT domain